MKTVIKTVVLKWMFAGFDHGWGCVGWLVSFFLINGMSEKPSDVLRVELGLFKGIVSAPRNLSSVYHC